ncbi:MAG: VWA domain-containing protein, partial [Myxococcales bacterium]
MSQLAKDRKGERGVVLVLFVLASIVVFAVTGLCVDLGMAYVRRSTLAKAADAGALAGARHTHKGDQGLKQIVRKVAQANYGIAMEDETEGGNYKVKIIRPGDDVVRIEVLGDTVSPTFFTKMLGREDVTIKVASEATRFPLDMSLVLDLSYSLQRNNAFDDMQDAASGFLQNFDDNTDQFGIVTYSTWAEEVMSLRKNFTSTGTSIIDGLAAISDTNISEGLRLAKAQHDSALPRTAALKVVVLFTDGRPTAFADNFWMDGATDTCAAEETSGTSGAVGFARIVGSGSATGYLGSAPGGTTSGSGIDSD